MEEILIIGLSKNHDNIAFKIKCDSEIKEYHIVIGSYSGIMCITSIDKELTKLLCKLGVGMRPLFRAIKGEKLPIRLK